MVPSSASPSSAWVSCCWAWATCWAEPPTGPLPCTTRHRRSIPRPERSTPDRSAPPPVDRVPVPLDDEPAGSPPTRPDAAATPPAAAPPTSTPATAATRPPAASKPQPLTDRTFDPPDPAPAPPLPPGPPPGPPVLVASMAPAGGVLLPNRGTPAFWSHSWAACWNVGLPGLRSLPGCV